MLIRHTLPLGAEDETLLDALRYRLREPDTVILRWALRWYAAGGPWRRSDEPLPADVLQILTHVSVGPQILGEVDHG